jgi:hypothetical protein
MADKNPYSSPGREQHGPAQVKEWPAKVLPAPQPLPGQSTKKSPTK